MKDLLALMVGFIDEDLLQNKMKSLMKIGFMNF